MVVVHCVVVVDDAVAVVVCTNLEHDRAMVRVQTRHPKKESRLKRMANLKWLAERMASTTAMTCYDTAIWKEKWEMAKKRLEVAVDGKRGVVPVVPAVVAVVVVKRKNDDGDRLEK